MKKTLWIFLILPMMMMTSCEEDTTVDDSVDGDGVVDGDTTTDDDDDVVEDEESEDTVFPTDTPDEEKMETPTPGDDSWRAIVSPTDYYGRVFSKHFYDLKYSAGAISTLAKARTWFQDDKMTGVRISIFGNDDKPAHPEAGTVVESYYTSTLTSIKYAREALAEVSDEPLIIFASKKLEGGDSYPDWVKDNPDTSNTINPYKYSELVYDYVNYMYTQGVEIDVLGVDNESEYSQSGLTAATWYSTVYYVKERLEEAGLKIPQFIGPENFGVKNSWFSTLANNATYNSALDVYGIHYYPNQRSAQYSYLASDAALVGADREYWATEPHWNIDSNIPSGYTDVIHYCECTVGAIWDHTDLGVDAMMWWSYSRSGDVRGNIMHAITVPIVGAQPIVVSDHDGFSIRTEKKLQTRAFRNGSTIYLYIMNVCGSSATNTSFTNYEFMFTDGELYPTATVQQWRDDTAVTGETTTIETYNGESIYLDIPSRSFTLVTLNIDMRDVEKEEVLIDDIFTYMTETYETEE